MIFPSGYSVNVCDRLQSLPPMWLLALQEQPTLFWYHFHRSIEVFPLCHANINLVFQTPCEHMTSFIRLLEYHFSIRLHHQRIRLPSKFGANVATRIPKTSNAFLYHFHRSAPPLPRTHQLGRPLKNLAAANSAAPSCH